MNNIVNKVYRKLNYPIVKQAYVHENKSRLYDVCVEMAVPKNGIDSCMKDEYLNINYYQSDYRDEELAQRDLEWFIEHTIKTSEMNNSKFWNRQNKINIVENLHDNDRKIMDIAIGYSKRWDGSD